MTLRLHQKALLLKKINHKTDKLQLNHLKVKKLKQKINKSNKKKSKYKKVCFSLKKRICLKI